MDRDELNARLPALIDAIVQGIQREPKTTHLDRVYLPSRDQIVECIGLLRQILFPGYFDNHGLNSQNIGWRIGELVTEVTHKLYDQVRHCLRYRQQIPGEDDDSQQCVDCDLQAAEAVAVFLERIPTVRTLL